MTQETKSEIPGTSAVAAALQALAARQSAAETRAPSSPANDDFCRIEGITPEIEQRLQDAGITAYSQIAEWSSHDCEYYSRIAYDEDWKKRDVAKEQDWVGQATILAAGGSTDFSKKYDADRA